MKIQWVTYVEVVCRLQTDVHKRGVEECPYPSCPCQLCSLPVGCQQWTVWQPVRVYMCLWGMGPGDQVRAKH